LKALPAFLALGIRLLKSVQVAADDSNDPALSHQFTTSLADEGCFAGPNSFADTVKQNRNPDSGA
jgi:hypothetical protein